MAVTLCKEKQAGRVENQQGEKRREAFRFLGLPIRVISHAAILNLNKNRCRKHTSTPFLSLPVHSALPSCEMYMENVPRCFNSTSLHSGLVFLHTSLLSALKREEMERRLKLKASEAQQAYLSVFSVRPSVEWIAVSAVPPGCRPLPPGLRKSYCQ